MSLWYCDTDNVFTTTRIKTGKNLGDWDEQAVIKKAVFILPKVYAFETFEAGKDGKKVKVKMKGVKLTDKTKMRKNSRLKKSGVVTGEMIKMHHLEEALKGNPIDIFQTGGVEKLKTALKSTNKFFIAKKSFVKRIKFNYKKRISFIKENRTEPIKARSKQGE
ncbi:MAG: hypothetical protein PHN88_16240 [Ignavibacteria bacterium]|nr:hypothetical protein [Ignavibacteria bacterium]